MAASNHSDVVHAAKAAEMTAVQQNSGTRDHTIDINADTVEGAAKAAEMRAVQQNSGSRDHTIDVDVDTVEGANAAVASDGGGGSSSICSVCMEPMEWAAYGKCGHQDVCATCAIRIRSWNCDRRCCICRTHCPTVCITNVKVCAAADARGGAKGWKPPAIAAAEGRVGKYWYYEGAAAYFEDEQMYREVRPNSRPESSCSPQCPFGINSESSPWIIVVIIAYILLTVPSTIYILQHRRDKLLLLGLGALFVASTQFFRAFRLCYPSEPGTSVKVCILASCIFFVTVGIGVAFYMLGRDMSSNLHM